MSAETKEFQAEVGKLLDLMIHSLYSHKEIFLRELISNASDACDRLRYAALTQPELIADDPKLRVTIAVDKAKRRITVTDNGIGMNREELIENLGTIARSGTAQFVTSLTGDAKHDMSLIGQFGVGFYSAFMVADKVEVTSARAGEDGAWRWTSSGAGSYSIEQVGRGQRGTSVVLHLRRGESEFLDEQRLRGIVKTYSDHIGLPIALKTDSGEETVNAASALWTRPRGEISDAQYAEFYRHVAHATDEPWLTLHNKAEGRLEYTSLLFLPTVKPFDLFHAERKHGVKLYVKRVFITDDCADLMPSWLRFVRGVVDSEDLPLNVSRETLQKNPLLARIRQALVKRVLDALDKKAKDEPEPYHRFWDGFGAVLKEGVYEDTDHRARLLPLIRCRSTDQAGLVGLGDYVARMKPGQDAIFYLFNEDPKAQTQSPQLEGFRARGVEVLLFSDPVDEFWIGATREYLGKRFQSITRGGVDLSAIQGAGAPAPSEPDAGMDELVAAMRKALGDAVRDVRASQRLTDSAVCLIADAGAIDLHLEKLLRQHNRIDSAARRILEVNPGNDLIRALAARAGANAEDPVLAEAAQLLLDQARILEGEPLPDPAGFARRLSAVIAKSLA